MMNISTGWNTIFYVISWTGKRVFSTNLATSLSIKGGHNIFVMTSIKEAANNSKIQAVKFSLEAGMSFINLDVLEEYFGKYRSIGCRNDNTDLL